MPGCANYDYHYGGCLFADTCLIEQGKRCEYFEKKVLPTAADIGLREQVYALYRKQVGVEDRYAFETQRNTRPNPHIVRTKNRKIQKFFLVL
jgi:hypothetical protein